MQYGNGSYKLTVDSEYNLVMGGSFTFHDTQILTRQVDEENGSVEGTGASFWGGRN